MRNIHIVSHTHWDREWYRPFQDFRLKLVHLIDGLLDLLEKDPQFKYFMLDGQSIVLDDYLAVRPEKEAILRHHIQEGRIIIGPWHILPDMFLVGPEAHIRNLLQGNRTAKKFGPKMMIGYLPDPFGHPGQVPQILRGFGIDTACLWRGLDDQPTELFWQSPDGTRVLLVNLRESYSNGASLSTDNPPAFAATLTLAADSLAAYSAVSNYLIMYGTDHMEPSVGTSNAIAYAERILAGTHVFHSTLPKFVDAIKADIKRKKLVLPTVMGELRASKRVYLLPGVLSTRVWIKQRNHSSENLLTKWVEPITVFQESITGGIPSSILNRKSEIVDKAWRLLMENHPHDSICGCSIDQVHDEMKVRFDQVDQIAGELIRQTLDTLTGSINTISSTENQKSAIVVFNPVSATRTDLVTLTLELPPNVEAFDLVDELGVILPHQAHGLEGRELINMIFDPKSLQSAFGFISEGRAAGMTIQDVRIRQAGSQVYIDAVMAEGGEPNLVVWKAGLKQIETTFADPVVTEYHVRGYTVPTARTQFIAPQIPGLGYRTFWIRPRLAEKSASIRVRGLIAKALFPLARLPLFQALAPRLRNASPPYRIENEYFIVEAARDGTLAVQDKRGSQRYTGLNRFLDGGDCGDEYNYSPPATDRFIFPHRKRVIVERSPVQQSLRLELDLPTPASLASDRKSRSKTTLVMHISSLVTLSSGVPRVDICSTIENRARDHRLRVHFPAPFAVVTSSQDGHFEVVDRQIGLPPFDDTWVEQPRPEVPQRAFTDISDGRSGLMVANRGLPEAEVLKNMQGEAEIALTLLRCVGWLSRDDLSTRKGHAGPFMETPGAQMPGEWTFDYSIIPHSGTWQSAFSHAYAFETPLRAVNTGLHAGALPSAGSFLESTPVNFVVSAVKQAERGRGWLVRGYNITGESISVTLKPWKPFKQVHLVNLAEEKQSSLKPDQTGCVKLPVPGHGIVSLLFRD
jgi:mannosylglycerate hydrolase